MTHTHMTAPTQFLEESGVGIPMHYAAFQTTEQFADVCLAVGHPPSSYKRIYLIDNLLAGLSFVPARKPAQNSS